MRWLVCFVCLFYVVFAQSPEKEFTTLLDSAGVLQNKKQYEKAIQICKEAMILAEKQWGQDTHYSKALRRMADCYAQLQKFDTALIYYQQDSALRKNIQGENHPEYAGSLHNLVTLYADIGKYTEAERFYLQSAAIYKQTPGKNYPEYMPF